MRDTEPLNQPILKVSHAKMMHDIVLVHEKIKVSLFDKRTELTGIPGFLIPVISIYF